MQSDFGLCLGFHFLTRFLRLRGFAVSGFQGWLANPEVKPNLNCEYIQILRTP